MLTHTLRRFDDLLRGDATRLPDLATGRFELPVGGLSILLTILGMIYGACMGLFAITPNGSGHGLQVLATTLKVPALFLLTLLVTFPSLYVFNTLFGTRLRFMPMLRLLIGTLTVTLAVLSSIGPIVGFFSVSSTSYAFVVLMNVVVFTLAAVLGLSFLLQTLHRIDVANLPDREVPVATDVHAAEDEPVARPRPSAFGGFARRLNGWTVLLVWMFIFGIVGAQMGWVLRPFIGAPGHPFTWFRPISGNFFEAVFTQAQRLMAGR